MDQNDVSRRDVLEWAGAAAGLAMLGGTAPALAQAEKRIEQLDPDLAKFVSVNEPVRELMNDPSVGWAEGPVWWKDDGGYLLFSDVRFARRMKYTPGGGVTVAQVDTNEGNGLTRDVQGRLVVCERATRQMTRIEADGKRTVLADNYGGKRLYQPNDVVVKSDGGIYFTDPNVDNINSPGAVAKPGLYRIEPDLSQLTLLTDSLANPNGLAFSPDEKVLYVVAGGGDIHAFDVDGSGMLTKSSERLFTNLRGTEPGGPDGIKVDMAGNVYSGGPGGVWIVDPTGKKLGRIIHGAPNTTNIAFGGPDFKTLYFTSSPGLLKNAMPPTPNGAMRASRLGAVTLKIAGVPLPAKAPK